MPDHMPRFFIDLHDGSELIRDTEGFELPDGDAAREKVLRIVSRIAQDFLPDVERQDYVAGLRDESGRVLLRARLSLVIEASD